MEYFEERDNYGAVSEQYVRAELEQRGYFVHPWGRCSFPDVINKALNAFRDTYERPCRLRWQPEFLIVRPDDPQTLRAVEVKRHRGRLQVSRFALNTYLRLETELWTPVLIVFHCPELCDPDTPDTPHHVLGLGVLPAGECLLSGINKYGCDKEISSGDPFFNVDPKILHPFDKFFGAKLPQ
jgi:hypothetical protein